MRKKTVQNGIQWKDEPLADSWAEHANVWDELVTRYSLPVILRSRCINAVVNTLAVGNSGLRLLTAFSDGVPAFMAIGRRRNAVTFEIFRPSQIPIALALAENSSALHAFVLGYLRQRRLPLLQFEIYQADSKFYASLGSTQHSCDIEYITAPYIDLPENFEEYFQGLSKNFRTNCKKQRNKLDTLGVTPRLVLISKAEDVAVALQHYSELELLGWKLRSGTAVSGASGQLDFYTALLESFAEVGQTQIAQYWLKIDGEDRLVASDLCIVAGETAYMLKTAYDESLEASENLSSLSPASLMHQELFKYWIHVCGVRRVEFYGKTMDWHLRWTKQQRLIYHTTLFRSAFVRKLITFAKQNLRKAAVAEVPKVS